MLRLSLAFEPPATAQDAEPYSLQPPPRFCGGRAPVVATGTFLPEGRCHWFQPGVMSVGVTVGPRSGADPANPDSPRAARARPRLDLAESALARHACFGALQSDRSSQADDPLATLKATISTPRSGWTNNSSSKAAPGETGQTASAVAAQSTADSSGELTRSGHVRVALNFSTDCPPTRHWAGSQASSRRVIQRRDGCRWRLHCQPSLMAGWM